MNNRRLSYGLLLTLATTLVAACGEPAPAVTPPAPSASAAEAPPPAPAPTPEPVPTAAPTATADATPPPPPPKAAKEKLAGRYVQDFSGEVKDSWETANKKKFAKDKDSKKHDDAAKKEADNAAKHTLEVTGDTVTISAGGKAVHTVKYEASGSDPATVTIKLTKETVGKKDKDLKGLEAAITFIDDDTITMKDPFAKDPKKAPLLVFKRQK